MDGYVTLVESSVKEKALAWTMLIDLLKVRAKILGPL
jgi:hypothetical protein